jgi:predicted MFS family arabinose efflux permease
VAEGLPASPVVVGGGTTAVAVRPALYTRPFLATSIVGLLCYSAQMIIQPILPIMVLERGGDATMVGLIIAAFSIPSVITRPVMGRLVDEWSNRGVLAFAGAGIGIVSFIYLVPSLLVIFLDRIAHGVAWAAFGAGGNAMAARLAPPSRRGEASSVYNLTAGIAQTVMPFAGLLLLAATTSSAPFVVAGFLGFAALAVVIIAVPDVPRMPHTSSQGRMSSILEPGAVLPMVFEFCFTSVSSLFLIYPPVFAAQRGLPIQDFAFYYLLYGAVLVTSRLITGRFIDRLPRAGVMTAGVLIAIVSLLVATQADSVATLTLAGVLYALAASFTSPTFMAVAIDRSDPRRVGAAMATYTLGFQLGLGVGAAMWGLLIDRAGYPAPYVAAIALQVALLVILGVTVRGERPGRGSPVGQGAT